MDSFFDTVLTVPEETPIIIKYLFDFIDGMAARWGISDLDTIHTWKCNR